MEQTMNGRSAVFTLCLVLAGAAGANAAAQTPRDRPPPGQPSATQTAEAALRDRIAASPHDPQPRIELSALQEETGRIENAETTLLEALRAVGPSAVLMQALARLHNRQGDFEKTMHYLEEAAALEPGDPRPHHLIAAHYQEKATRDYRLPPWQKRAYVEAGIAAEDRALFLDPDYVDALVYKNVLLRMLANLESDPGAQQRLITEANALRERALHLQKSRGGPFDSPVTAPRAP
jgi:tetratricopeptide (TPR) repeat protein